ncbi:MAG: alpha/beta hydrolase [Deferrisomatales bacterium]|nr:alpha/beta hydrolase [Deferrisomatales bacterium]
MVTRSLLGLGPHGFHRVAYHEWGDPANPRVVVCVHGLTRNGRDFDVLASALAGLFRVACPDLPGRGQSEWLPHPAGYAYPVYLSDMVALLARLDGTAVDWVGTSLGGLLGMMLAAQPGTPLRRLVLNDVGPFLPKKSLRRIGEYVGADPRFADFRGLEGYLREVHAPFGPLTGEQWQHLAKHSARGLPDGTLALHYDPGIGAAFRASSLEDVDLWTVWDAVRCPVLVLRGAESDLLTRETAEEMARRGPRARVVELPGVGHAPALLEERQVETVRSWLSEVA